MSSEGGISATNKVILAAATILMASAIGYSVWRDQAAPPLSQNAASADPADHIASLEKAVQDHPDQADAWSALATAHYDRSDFRAAAEAFRKAADISPNSAGLWAALGEALIMASERDPMPPAAAEAFEKSVALDPKEPRARYFLAVKKDLAGDHQGAIDAWFALLADTPAGAPWEADLRRTIEQVGAIHKIDVASRLAATSPRPPSAAETPVAAQAIPGPSRADMEAAAQLPKGQQDAMIAGMISSLEAKIAADPQNVDQWIMLMRSRMTLGESSKAAKALQDAIAANPQAAPKLRSQAEMLGVPAR